MKEPKRKNHTSDPQRYNRPTNNAFQWKINWPEIQNLRSFRVTRRVRGVDLIKAFVFPAYRIELSLFGHVKWVVAFDSLWLTRTVAVINFSVWSGVVVVPFVCFGRLRERCLVQVFLIFLCRMGVYESEVSFVLVQFIKCTLLCGVIWIFSCVVMVCGSGWAAVRFSVEYVWNMKELFCWVVLIKNNINLYCFLNQFLSWMCVFCWFNKMYNYKVYEIWIGISNSLFRSLSRLFMLSYDLHVNVGSDWKSKIR